MSSNFFRKELKRRNMLFIIGASAPIRAKRASKRSGVICTGLHKEQSSARKRKATRGNAQRYKIFILYPQAAKKSPRMATSAAFFVWIRRLIQNNKFCIFGVLPRWLVCLRARTLQSPFLLLALSTARNIRALPATRFAFHALALRP